MLARIVSSDFSSKKTPLSLPHCHPIPIEGCNVEWQEVENGLKCVVTVSTTSKTGVEMEALVAFPQISLRLGHVEADTKGLIWAISRYKNKDIL